MQPQDRARPAGDLLLVVGVAQEGEERAVDAERRLDHVRDVALLVADPLERRARVLGVLAQVVVAAVRDALELLPADREEVLDVARRARVVRELVRVVRAHAQVRRADAEAEVPAAGAARSSTRATLGASAGGTKNSISICSNSRMRKRKLPGVISLRKLLPICAMPNGGLTRIDEVTFLKLTKMPCAVSGRR